jgi:hypothetical protein
VLVIFFVVVLSVFGFVSAPLQGFQTCAVAEASPKNQNSPPPIATSFLSML